MRTFPDNLASNGQSTQKLNLALIYGSNRDGRFCDKLAAWAQTEIARSEDFALDRIDPAASELCNCLFPASAAASGPLRKRIAEADAFLVVTPEYNHGYPAALKALIDSAYAEWRAKPVAFLSYGGISGGLRAVEQLRQVFAELHTVTIRDTVSFSNPWTCFEPQRAEAPMALMLERLKWWGHALQQARRTMPYAA